MKAGRGSVHRAGAYGTVRIVRVRAENAQGELVPPRVTHGSRCSKWRSEIVMLTTAVNSWRVAWRQSPVAPKACWLPHRLPRRGRRSSADPRNEPHGSGGNQPHSSNLHHNSIPVQGSCQVGRTATGGDDEKRAGSRWVCRPRLSAWRSAAGGKSRGRTQKPTQPLRQFTAVVHARHLVLAAELADGAHPLREPAAPHRTHLRRPHRQVAAPVRLVILV
jgi:hypothetical protein